MEDTPGIFKKYQFSRQAKNQAKSLAKYWNMRFMLSNEKLDNIKVELARLDVYIYTKREYNTLIR